MCVISKRSSLTTPNRLASSRSKQRPGYANFATEQPPLQLVLFENPDAVERIHHLGVEVFEQETVWSREPQGLRWEWYRMTDDDPAEAAVAVGTACCADANKPGKVYCLLSLLTQAGSKWRTRGMLRCRIICAVVRLTATVDHFPWKVIYVHVRMAASIILNGLLTVSITAVGS